MGIGFSSVKPFHWVEATATTADGQTLTSDRISFPFVYRHLDPFGSFKLRGPQTTDPVVQQIDDPCDDERGGRGSYDLTVPGLPDELYVFTSGSQLRDTGYTLAVCIDDQAIAGPSHFVQVPGAAIFEQMAFTVVVDQGDELGNTTKVGAEAIFWP